MSDKNPEKKVLEEIGNDAQSPESANKKPRMEKKLKVFLIVLIILALIIGFLCVRFWHIISLVANKENIDAYLNARKYTAQEIESRMTENKEKMEKLAEESPLIQIRGELTEEEIEALKNGEITPEEAKSIVKGDITLEEILEGRMSEEDLEENDPSDEKTSDEKKENDEKKPSEDKTTSKPSSDKVSSKPSEDKSSSKPASDKKPTTSPKPTQPQDRVSEIVSELYVIQADFLSRLEAVGDQAYADYKATHYDRSQVMSIVDSYTATVGAMESECDRKVNTLIKELKTELTKAGKDHSLAKEVQNYYYTEKSLKKSYYLNMLENEDYK